MNESLTSIVTSEVTPASDIPADVSSEQWTAIEKLSTGKSIVDAAAAAGVSRWTLHRWIKNDPHFQAAYNAWHIEVAATARARLLALIVPVRVVEPLELVR